MHLAIILIKRIPLLQVHFRHFISKQGTIFKDICFKQGTHFCSTCFSSGLMYYRPANWSFRRQMLCANYFIITYYIYIYIYKYIYSIFFRIRFSKKKPGFFAFWRKKIRRHLVKGVLSYVVFCKV